MIRTRIKAIDALKEAQKIAFAPFVFQTVVCLRDLGILQLIFENDRGGLTLTEISEHLQLSDYGIGVLLEIAESSNMVRKNEAGAFQLTKTGYFLTYDPTVQVNINFTQDVCYQGLFHLKEAIKNEKPEGLKVFGNWQTIYQGLSELDAEVQKSWFAFDHHYSDGIFEEALPIVFQNKPSHIFDIGGNTGKFALKCLNFDTMVRLTIFDLPGQLEKALQNIRKNNFDHRVSGKEIDWLQPTPSLPTGADCIWMSQFLDCFSEEEIQSILTTCVAAMSSDTTLIINETFTDRQEHAHAKFALEATSLYFTALANGNSKMYDSKTFYRLIDRVGLTILEDRKLGKYHTLLTCKKK